MNIQNFKNALGSGGARANLFRVSGSFPATALAIGAASGGGNPAQQIEFLCKAAEIPAVQIGVINVPFQGRNLKVAGDREFPDWNITVLNDNNFNLRNAFEAWQNLINRIESNISRNGLGEYAQQWSVTQLSRDGKDLKKYTFIDCWPSSVSNIALNFDQATQIEEFNVTMSYQYYIMQGTSS